MTSDISVCIPTYNGAHFLQETIQSVLEQDCNFELILCDGGSSDDSIDIIQSFNDPRIRFIDNKDAKSPAENWNASTVEARAPFVKVMGQDDTLLKGCLRNEIEMLSTTYASGSVFCFSRRLTLIGEKICGRYQDFDLADCQIVEAGTLLERIVRSGRNPIGEPVAVTIRREALGKVGGYRGSYVIDLDLYVRLLALGPAVESPATLTAFRISGSSWSFALRKTQATEVLQLHERIRSEYQTSLKKSSLAIGGLLARIFPVLRVAITALSWVMERFSKRSNPDSAR